jgi:hypothetical protein
LPLEVAQIDEIPDTMHWLLHDAAPWLNYTYTYTYTPELVMQEDLGNQFTSSRHDSSWGLRYDEFLSDKFGVLSSGMRTRTKLPCVLSG